MRRGTIFVIIFILIAAAIVGASQFLRSQPALEITVAVSPLAEKWAQTAVDAFNASDLLVNSTRRVRVSLMTVGDMEVWQDERRVNWTQDSHPIGWIPSSSLSVQYAVESRLPFEVVVPSLARTPLMWGGFESRVNVVSGSDGKPLDWAAVGSAVSAERWDALPGGDASWQFVKLAFEQPNQSIGGLAALFSGAAYYVDNADISRNITNDPEFRAWVQKFVDSVPNFATLGADPAAAMASRGASVGEIALLPESRWLTNLDGLVKQEAVRLSYPEYQFVMDFPLARWNDTTLTDEQRQALDALGRWLLDARQQAQAPRYGLRPAASDPLASDALFALAQPYGAQLALPSGETIIPPSRTETQRLLQWFSTVR